MRQWPKNTQNRSLTLAKAEKDMFTPPSPPSFCPSVCGTCWVFKVLSLSFEEAEGENGVSIPNPYEALRNDFKMLLRLLHGSVIVFKYLNVPGSC